jgi:hypothetical protein
MMNVFNVGVGGDGFEGTEHVAKRGWRFRRWFVVLGTHEGCPYRMQGNNAVHVIGHDNALIEGNVGKYGWQFVPAVTDRAPGGIEVHCRVRDFTEQWQMMIDTNRDSIEAGRGVVPIF